VTVNGNLTVLGSQTQVNTEILSIKDAGILIANNNNADAIQAGMQVQYKPSGSADVKFAGLKRLPQSGEFVFFKDATSQIESYNDLTANFSLKWVQAAPNNLALSVAHTSPSANIVASSSPVEAYTLPAGSYTYNISSVTNSSNDAVVINLVNDANSAVIANLITAGQIQPWSTLQNVSGSFSLLEQTNVGIRFNNGYYQYSTGMSITFSRSVPTEAYAAVLADSFSSASDARLKNQVVNLDGALDKIDHIRGVYHHWIDENQPKERQIGVIAQEVQAIYPELVNEGGNGFLSVNYPKLTAVLLQSIKELKAMVLELAKKQ
jgi:hypothetical protein